MFGRKKPERPKRDHSGNLAQFGLIDIPDDFNPMNPSMDSDGGDSDLEAELAALAGGGSRPSKPKKPLKKPLSQGELDAMVSGTLKDIDQIEDEDVDENDPELLSELQGIAGSEEEEEEEEEKPVDSQPQQDTVDILTKRVKTYQTLEAEAKSAGETSKARRYGRAIKTLNDLLKKAKNGDVVDLSDETIPPEVQIKPKSPVPTRAAPQIPEKVEAKVAEAKKEIDQELLDMLLERQKEYKLAALQAKKGGNTETALGYLKIAKIFDHVIAAVKNGEAVDLSDMPGPPGEGTLEKLQEAEKQQKSEPAEVPEAPLPTAGTMEEALQQRFEFYKAYEQKAKEEDNSSKARRYGRIVKQYGQAIKAHKAGKPIEAEELPTPPGFPPLPSTSLPQVPPEQEPPKPAPSRQSGNKVSTTHQEKQVLILQAKQKQFKQAALNAKKQGEIEQAKEFLKQAKGFDKLIQAAQAGLPIDWGTIPVNPDAKSQLDDEYDIVMANECTEQDDTDVDLLTRLEVQLSKQLDLCMRNRKYNKEIGNIGEANRFERVAFDVTKDLDLVRSRKRTATEVPKFHYENRDFSFVKIITDLTDNQLEVFIGEGINYKTDYPKDIDTYVKFEFPFPTETPYYDKTATVKNTNNPVYSQSFMVPIQRDSRQCQRVFKRHGIKFEVYSKGCDCCSCASCIFSCFSGFFRSDTLIGTVNLKLQPLETQCEMHDSFDIMDGRRKTGGKLEVRLRVRTPIVTQEVKQVHEKWLVIDR